MFTKRKQPLATRISYVAAIGLTLAGLFVIGCGRPSPDSTASSSPVPATDATVIGVVLRADPNPVPGGNDVGKTTITWQTGSEAVADIYSVSGTDETLFATGPKGSKEAPFIRPGSNEFRLYNQGQHKLVAQLIVTMPASPASAASVSSTPASSTNQ
jgi:hypothetical protein